MPSRRTRAVTIASAVLLVGVATGGIALADRDDPTAYVEGVEVGDIDVGLPTDTAGTAQQIGQQVAALDSLQGTVERRGDDADDLYVGAVALEFGPEEWVITAGPSLDYDGDGTAEDLLVELDGLIGTEVSALVRLDADGDDADVYVLNGLGYRDSAGGPAPWLEGGIAAGEAATPQEVTEAAALAVGPGALVDELDREIAGEVAWEAEVIDADGVAYDVLLDANGEVLDVRLDD